MRDQAAKNTRFTSLQSRLIFILSLALLPLAFFSTFQTTQVIDDTERLGQRAILDSTTRAVAELTTQISIARGAAVWTGEAGAIDCAARLRNLRSLHPNFVRVAVIVPGNSVICDSVSETVIEPLELGPLQETEIAFLTGPDGTPFLRAISPTGIGNGIVLIDAIYMTPGRTGHAGLQIDLVRLGADGPVDVFGDALDIAPPADLFDAGGEPVRVSDAGDGSQTVFAIAPVFGEFYALGHAEGSLALTGVSPLERGSAVLFPVAMWIVGVLVAYAGLDLMVLRHVRLMRRWMQRFADGDVSVLDDRLTDPPEEVRALADSFRAMAWRVLEDEAEQERALREKTILLREVHHRVKNNLQLISSIVSLQYRKTRDPEARTRLKRVQERVLTLSAIHRHLYTARRLTKIKADALIHDVLLQVGKNKLGEPMEFDADLEPVEVTPDQAVPLALLVAEAAMVALQDAGAEELAGFRLTMSEADGGLVTLAIRVPAQDRANEDIDEIVTKSSRGLIRSLSAQLDGAIETRIDGGDRVIELKFVPLEAVGFDFSVPDREEEIALAEDLLEENSKKVSEPGNRTDPGSLSA